MTQTVELRTPRGNPARFAVREDTSDLAVVGSTFAGVAGAGLVDEYGLADLHIKGVFVDVGAHVGTVAIAVLIDNPGATAILVEPIPENVAMIRANLAENGLAERATVIEGAVGTDVITYLFDRDEFASTNRFIGNLTVPATRSAGTTIRVRRVELDDLLPCEAMKLDCEGGEWGLFADDRITTIPYVFGEYHGLPGPEGVSRRFGRTHAVEFTSIGQAAGNFRAVAR